MVESVSTTRVSTVKYVEWMLARENTPTREDCCSVNPASGQLSEQLVTNVFSL